MNYSRDRAEQRVKSCDESRKVFFTSVTVNVDILSSSESCDAYKSISICLKQRHGLERESK